MSVDRLVRVNELLKREIGDLLFRVVNEAGFDLSAVTITQVETSRDLRSARVLVSIRDHERERDRMLGLLRRHRGEFQSRINTDMALKYTPHLTFELDTSVEHGDRILHLLDQLEAEHPAPEAPPAEPPPAAPESP